MPTSNDLSLLDATGSIVAEGRGALNPLQVNSVDLPDAISFGEVANSDSVELRIAKEGTDSSVFDVAAYILSKVEKIAVSKLQLLLYYCQAWSLVWDDALAYGDAILAGPNGPYIDRIKEACLGSFSIEALPLGSSERVVAEIRETIEVVFQHYNQYSSQELVFMAQSEPPWNNARGHSVLGSCPAINLSDMQSYYRSLLNKNG